MKFKLFVSMVLAILCMWFVHTPDLAQADPSNGANSYPVVCLWQLSPDSTPSDPFHSPQTLVQCFEHTDSYGADYPVSEQCGVTLTFQLDHYTIENGSGQETHFHDLIASGVLTGPNQDAGFHPHDWSYPTTTSAECESSSSVPPSSSEPASSTPASSSDAPPSSTAPPSTGTRTVSHAPPGVPTGSAPTRVCFPGLCSSSSIATATSASQTAQSSSSQHMVKAAHEQPLSNTGSEVIKLVLIGLMLLALGWITVFGSALFGRNHTRNH